MSHLSYYCNARLTVLLRLYMYVYSLGHCYTCTFNVRPTLVSVVSNCITLVIRTGPKLQATEFSSSHMWLKY